MRVLAERRESKVVERRVSLRMYDTYNHVHRYVNNVFALYMYLYIFIFIYL